jgi:hypothetical protein
MLGGIFHRDDSAVFHRHVLWTLTLDIEKECEYYMPYEQWGKQLRSNSGRGAAR